MKQVIKTLTRSKSMPKIRRGDITRTIRAKFSYDVFRPLEKVEYPEGKEFTITIEDEDEKEEKLIIRDDLPYVSNEEQKEIEEILKNPDCHIFSSKKTVTIYEYRNSKI